MNQPSYRLRNECGEILCCNLAKTDALQLLFCLNSHDIFAKMEIEND
jgi:hypothetical protein